MGAVRHRAAHTTLHPATGPQWRKGKLKNNCDACKLQIVSDHYIVTIIRRIGILKVSSIINVWSSKRQLELKSILFWIFALVLDDADVGWLMTPPVSELPSDVSIVAQHNELSANNENNDNTISRHHDNHISHQPGSVSVLLRDTPHWSFVPQWFETKCRILRIDNEPYTMKAP